MDTIKVVMLTHGYLPCVGGAELQLAALAPLLRSRGCEIHILTRGVTGLPSYDRIDNTPVHRIPTYQPKTLASLTFTWSALSLIRHLHPDVIHAHALLSPTTTAILAKKVMGAPVVAKVLRGGTLGDLDRLKSKPFGRSRLKWFSTNVDAFISISREIDRELSDLGIPESRRPYIPNGVDTPRFAPVTPEEKRAIRAGLKLHGNPIVVFTGRLAAEKRVDQLLTIWPRVRTLHKNALLLILGNGEEKDRLKNLAGAGVIFPGRIEDVVPYLQAADLFVLPSATEGLSNALLEALSCGLPAVATDVGGASDVIIHGTNGWLIRPDQPCELEKAILVLLSNENLRASLAKEARNRILNSYSLPSTADRLESLYRKLAERRMHVS